MAKEKKKRTFESESLTLPALQMVVADNEHTPPTQSTRKIPVKRDKGFNEATVLRIIDKLISKE